MGAEGMLKLAALERMEALVLGSEKMLRLAMLNFFVAFDLKVAYSCFK